MQMISIVWFPHSGCRWLNRSLLARHEQIVTTEFCMPFLTISTDMILSLDKTAQVHKARTDSGLEQEFDILISSVKHGREEGIRRYFSLKREAVGKNNIKVCAGALSPGAPVPDVPDISAILRACPAMKILHLVRNPEGCYKSMFSRFEMDGHEQKIGSMWAGFNASIRGCDYMSEEQYYVLKYEDLVEDAASALRGLCAWLGLSYDPCMLDGVKEYHGMKKQARKDVSWTDAQIQRLKECVQTEASHYGYDM